MKMCVENVAHGSLSVVQILRKRYLKRRSVVVAALSYILFTGCMLAGRQFLHRESFAQALTARADADRYIILAMTDVGFVDIAINFYETSLRAHRIDNFLFVGVGRRTCEMLRNIPCFYYTDDPDQHQASSYGQQEYVRKMNIRTDMILEALRANFTVIHTDTDVTFFSNPLSEIKVITRV